MPEGPGKYDDLCTAARQTAEADAALLIIFGGNMGSGFSAQIPSNLVGDVPAILRAIADQIEESLPTSEM
jgi:hypothetical protein